MTVKKQKRINFNNECNCLVDENELEKAILWFQKSPTLGNKKIYMNGKYPAVSIGNIKIHVHRLLMQFWIGEKLPFHASVHHMNENKLDARMENLAVVINKAHNSNHNKGKKISEEHKKKIIEANRKRKGIRMKRKYDIPTNQLKDLLKHGISIRYISHLYNCDWTTIKSRIIENSELLEVTDE